MVIVILALLLLVSPNSLASEVPCAAALCNKWHCRLVGITLTVYWWEFQQAVQRVMVWLPRDAMHKHGLCRHTVSSCIVSKWIKISSFFSPSGSNTILVFPHQTGWQYSDRNPPNGGVECRWGRYKLRFWAYLAVVLAVSTATCQTLSTRSPVDHGHRLSKLWHIAGSKRRCWLWEKMTKCLWQEASTLRQRQQNSAFNCTHWQICSLRN